MGALLVITIILWALSGIGLVVLIMLHSGKGTGVGDILASSFSGSMSGTTVLEKNLDRLTVICAVIFFVCIFVMMIIYPH